MAYDIGQVSYIFDELSTKIKAQLDEEYRNGRIKGTEYADVYNELMKSILGLAFDAPLKEKQLALSEADLGLKEKQLGLRKILR